MTLLKRVKTPFFQTVLIRNFYGENSDKEQIFLKELFMQVIEYEEDFSKDRTKNVEEYGRFQQHLVLVEDEVRLRAFNEAISECGPGNIVLDIGAGTGILSLFALKAGFRKAILIEPSKKISTYAQYLLTKNGFADRFTIINSKLEDVDILELPGDIDLVVSETISSLILGFGSWDFISKIKTNLRRTGIILPRKGILWGFLAETDMATRNPSNSGLKYCSQVGIDFDLYYRTFRSGGNIFNKHDVNAILSEKDVFQFFKFDFDQIETFSNFKLSIKANNKASYTGAVFYWDIYLNQIEKPALTSLDPELTSWYPIYIPFKRKIGLEKGDILHLRIEKKAIDVPYDFAFQIYNGDVALTNILYW